MATQRSRTATKKASPAIAMQQAGAGQHAGAPDPIGAAVEALTEPDHSPVVDHSGTSVAAVAAAQAEPHLPVADMSAQDAGPPAEPIPLPAPAVPAMDPAQLSGAPYLVLARAAAELQGKAIDMMQANAVQAMTYAEALSGVRSVSAAVELQAEHVRRQFEIMTEQARQWTALVEKVTGNSLGNATQGERV